MSENRLGIETFPNQMIREYHVNGAVSNTKIFEITRDQLKRYPAKSVYGVEIDSETQQMVDEIFRNRAIEQIGLDETTVRVTLRDMFYWHEAQDDVIDAILHRLGWLKEETSIVSMHDFRFQRMSIDAETVPADEPMVIETDDAQTGEVNSETADVNE